MGNDVNLIMTRFNIYSCLTLVIGNKQICFDPAKIRKQDLEMINPDIIFISHESMDHMNPTQVYFLQKKKNCKIFCSIATAVDLIQYFPLDIDFVDSVNVMIPGCKIVCDEIEIITGHSIHCDYMLPVVFRLNFLQEKISLLHCFDTHLSEEIIKLSEGTDLAIIPIGIAKGVSEITGFEFANQLKSRYFITNHFKDESELSRFHKLIENSSEKDRFFLVNWNESCQLHIAAIQNSKISERLVEENAKVEEFDKVCDKILLNETISSDQLEIFVTYFYNKRCHLFTKESLIKNLLGSYAKSSEKSKRLILVAATILCLLNPALIDEKFIHQVKLDALLQSSDKINSLKAMALFFLGLCSQQKVKNYCLIEMMTMVNDAFDHINYWIVEYLGRCATSKGNDYENAIDALIRITTVPYLYHSVVVRRKLFWEFHRIMKYLPQISCRFFKIFEDGLDDSNPDVRLLALLCFGLANRIYYLTGQQLDKIFLLFKDPEDDVRETAVKVVGALSKNHKSVIVKNLDQIYTLLEDKNCHVQFAAKEACELVNV